MELRLLHLHLFLVTIVMMTPSFSLKNIDRSKTPLRSREEHLAILERWKEADKRLQKRCEELGIAVPIMVC